MASLDKNDVNPLDEDAPGQPISVPDSGDTGESGKLKMIVSLVKKCLGVKDIAAMYVSIHDYLLATCPPTCMNQASLTSGIPPRAHP